jgi:anaerobic selenocysteine-containing dehydrogenase
MDSNASTAGTGATEHHNACVLCSHNCGLRVQVENNRIVGVRPDFANPITRGYMCQKGDTIAHHVEHAQRLQQPLKRAADGTFEPISWDQALREIGARLRQIADLHSPRALALIGIGGQANHMDAYYASAFREALGTPWWFNTFAQEKTQHPLVDKWLFNASTEAWLEADIEHSSYVVLLGTNPMLSHRGRNATEAIKALRQTSERTLVVVDPRRTETAARADVHVALQPGSDVFFMLGLAAHIVQSGQLDQAFLAEHAVHTEALLSQLQALDVQDLAARCGIETGQLTAVADGFARAQSACMYMDLGLEQGLFSTLTAYLARVIQVLTGNLGKRGGAVFHGMFAPRLPPMAAATFSAPVSGIEAIAALGPFGMFSPNLFPEEVLKDHPERIRAAIVEGCNPVVQYADSQRYREAFARLELLVVIEPAFTETARLADYVLPTPVGYEKWEWALFPKRYPEVHVHLRPPILRGPEQALPEAEIYARLAREAGVVPRAPGWLHRLARKANTGAGALGYLTALSAAAAVSGGRAGVRTGQARGAILGRLVFWAYESLGANLPAPQLITPWLLAQLFALTRREDVLRAFPEWSRIKNPCALGLRLYAQILEHPEGTLVGQLDPAENLSRHCRYADGKLRLSHADMLREIDRALAFRPHADPVFPFVLNGGRRTFWNANTVQRDPDWRRGKGPHCALAMCATDAHRLGLTGGDRVEVATRRGAVELPLAIDDTLRVGHVSIPNGFGLEYPDHASGELVRTGVSINELTESAARDPFTGSPHHKYLRCAVRAVEAKGLQ